MAKKKVGEDEAVAGANGLWLANDVPVGSCLSKLANESLLQLAIERTRLLGTGDRVSIGEHEIHRLASHNARRVQ
jgi:hypothetical protein